MKIFLLFFYLPYVVFFPLSFLLVRFVEYLPRFQRVPFPFSSIPLIFTGWAWAVLNRS